MNDPVHPPPAPRGKVRRWVVALWAVILIGLPLMVAMLSTPRPSAHDATTPRTKIARAPSRPPSVEPVKMLAIAPADARAINTAIPFSTAPNPAAQPFRFTGDAASLARATDCLAAAQLYEAGDDPSGQAAVAQVVINRTRHPAFPGTICGVVFQGAERATGCQFTFTCDGALARHPSTASWERAQTLAASMLSGKVDNRVGLATHYHTDWVVPYWSSSLNKITSVDSHLFFRWKGWWGTPGAFRGASNGVEPVIAKIAFLSPAHVSTVAPVTVPLAQMPEFADLSRPAMVIGRDHIGRKFGPARLASINSAGDAFIMLLDRNAAPAAFDAMAQRICAGRTKCRLLGWTRTDEAPNAFPVADAALATMSYAYLRITDSSLERSLYNCSEFPDQPKNRCMRERSPAALPAPPSPSPPRTGTETFRLTP